MKIMISYQVDTVEEAKEVMAAVENRGKLTTFRVQDEVGLIVATAQELAYAEKAVGVIPAAAARPNINPGTPLITKIGTATKELIFDDLRHDTQPPQPKYTEHLKLLWSRGEVKFDGSEYYL